MKKYLITLLCLLLAVCCAHPALADDTFAFDKTVTELFEGETLQTVLIRDGAYAEGEVTYTTSSPKVATVDANGVVTGLKKGDATITAKCGSKKATVRLTVVRAVTSIEVDEEKLIVLDQHDPALAGVVHIDEEDTRKIIVLRKGKSVTLSVDVAPRDASSKKLTVSTTDEDVVKVSDKKLTGKELGECAVTISSVQNPEVSVSYRVLVVEPVTAVKLDAADDWTLVGGRLTLTASVKPAEATLQSLVWTSSKESVAVVDQSGVVTGVGKGSATITATAMDGSDKKDTFKVTVKQQPTGIELGASSLTLYVGSEEKLAKAVQPSNSTYTKVDWTSSNPNVAKVNGSGVITPVAPGTCVITCSSQAFPEISASCTVTVRQRVKKVTVPESSVTVSAGSSLQLQWGIQPENADNKAVTFSSSKESVAKVDQSGVVTGISKGSATITITAADGSKKSATVKVTVTQSVTGMRLSETNTTVNVGSNKTLKATILPENANNKKVTWVSSNEGIARVNSSGVITPVAPGTCTVTCISQDNGSVTAVCTVTVQQPVKKIVLPQGSVTLYAGDTAQLGWSIEPANATNPAVTFSSSRPNIATVDANGRITGVNKGVCNIMIYAADGSGKKASVEVTVRRRAESIVLSETDITVNVGSYKTLKATVQPSDTNNKKVTWVSSNESIAKVNSSGKVTPVGPGTCTITCISQDNPNVTATCYVTSLQPVSKVSFSGNTVSFDVNTGVQLYWSVEPWNASNKGVTFTSSDERIATVDQNGYVYGVKRGSATITVTATDGSRKRDTIKVNVLQPVTGVHMENDHMRVGVGESIRANAVLEPYDASNTNMTWTTSDPLVASVRGSNNRPSITGVRWGTAIISGVTEDGGYSTFLIMDVGDYDRALRVTDLYLTDNVIKLSTLNESNLVITRFNMVFELYDIYDMPLPCNTLGTNTFVAGNAYMLLEGELTRHGSYYFYDFVQPTKEIGRVVCYITDYATDTGYRHYIEENKLEKIEFISPLFIGPEGLLPPAPETPPTPETPVVPDVGDAPKG